jgi:hypothetical protein
MKYRSWKINVDMDEIESCKFKPMTWMILDNIDLKNYELDEIDRD